MALGQNGICKEIAAHRLDSVREFGLRDFVGGYLGNEWQVVYGRSEVRVSPAEFYVVCPGPAPDVEQPRKAVKSTDFAKIPADNVDSECMASQNRCSISGSLLSYREFCFLGSQVVGRLVRIASASLAQPGYSRLSSISMYAPK